MLFHALCLLLSGWWERELWSWLLEKRLLQVSEAAESQAFGLNGTDELRMTLLPVLWSSAMYF